MESAPEKCATKSAPLEEVRQQIFGQLSGSRYRGKKCASENCASIVARGRCRKCAAREYARTRKPRPSVRRPPTAWCVKPGCGRPLRISNLRDVCHMHKRFTGTCLDCGTRIDNRYRRCNPCELQGRVMGRRRCSMSGCEQTTTGLLGYCRTHTYRSGRMCAVGGCGVELTVFNRSGYCGEHRGLARKEKAPWR
jgi:hypothetical protein